MRGEVCEIDGCESTNTETEEILGRTNTLCEKHGPEHSEFLSNVDIFEMFEWAMLNLKTEHVLKWADELVAEVIDGKCHLCENPVKIIKAKKPINTFFFDKDGPCFLLDRYECNVCHIDQEHKVRDRK